MKLFIPVIVLTLLLSIAPIIQARITPEDILNEKKENYNNRLKAYTPQNQSKINEFAQKVSALNKRQTDILEAQMIRQGEILNEFIFRNGIEERQADGISRNLQDPVENARYWLTFAHEAVAYQAAKVYVFNLTGETNIKNDITRSINDLNADMNILKGKVDKSRQLVEDLVLEDK